MIVDIVPTKDCLPKSCYEATKLVSKLGMLVEKIDCCENGCMLFYKEDSELVECRHCKEKMFHLRKTGMGKYNNVMVKRMFYFSIIPKLQRLYALTESTGQIR